MTDDEKKQYELARLGIARLMGDASEVEKWSKAVRQTRDAEQRDGADLAQHTCPACGGVRSKKIFGLTLVCSTCHGLGQV